MAFFMQNMTWLQPPGHVHAMISATWAPVSVAATFTTPNVVPFAAQVAVNGGATTLVLRAVNPLGGRQPLTINLQGAQASTLSYTLWLLNSTKPGDDNTPSAPAHISPVKSQQTMARADQLQLVLPPYSFAIAVVDA